MVKIVNELGEVKTGVQGEAVYQGRYGQQIRRTRQPKRAIPSQKQLEHRQLYREALAWRKALSLPNRRYLDGYCIANWIVDDYKIALPWSRFALKLYLEHIKFVIVEKPVMVYIPPPELEIEEQTQYSNAYLLNQAGFKRVAQKLTIPNRKLTKLAFYLHKEGNPTDPVTFAIRRVSDNSLIASKVWGNAADLPTVTTLEEVELDTPPVINEEVRIYAEYDYGDGFNGVRISYQNSNVKENECISYQTTGDWSDSETRDLAYCYTFYDWTHAEGGIDYEKSTKGLLHVRQPALLSGEHRRDGKLLEEWTNLSSLDDEYLTGQVGVDVFSGDELKFATIAGVEYAFRVP